MLKWIVVWSNGAGEPEYKVFTDELKARDYYDGISQYAGWNVYLTEVKDSNI